VIRTAVGYAGGKEQDPTYYHLGDHCESIRIEFDPSKISYEKLLELFWNTHSPCGKKSRQYRSVIFYHNSEQQRLAQKSCQEYEQKINKKVSTTIEKIGTFTNAEDYHQKYYLRHHTDIIQALNLSDEALITSHVACRLNGYVSGYGNIKQFRKELPTLKLPKMVETKLIQILKKGS